MLIETIVLSLVSLLVAWPEVEILRYSHEGQTATCLRNEVLTSGLKLLEMFLE